MPVIEKSANTEPSIRGIDQLIARFQAIQNRIIADQTRVTLESRLKQLVFEVTDLQPFGGRVLDAFRAQLDLIWASNAITMQTMAQFGSECQR